MERLARGEPSSGADNNSRPLEIRFAFDPSPRFVPGFEPSDPRDIPPG
jgi:hypothetical protein